MSEWAVRMEPEEAVRAATLRGVAGVLACADDGVVWVRVPAGERMESTVATLPGRRFRVLEDGQLVAASDRVPSAWLPDCEWQPIDVFFTVTLPVAGFVSGRASRVRLQLVRSTRETEADGLLVDAASWYAFVDTAPEVRLNCLRFAVSGDGRVLVLGEPLPPLPGIRLSVSHGIAIPCGLAWVPAVDAETVRRVFDVADDATVLWTDSDEREVVSSESLMRASRSSARAMQVLGDAGWKP